MLNIQSLKLFGVSILLLFSTLTFAENSTKPSINLYKYSDTTCKDYTGTWQGFMLDTAGLFGNTDQTWPITLHLYNQQHFIIGKTIIGTALLGNKNSELWASCNNGVLKNIFWGDKGACGGFSQEGLLINKNVFIIKLHWENAMTGTDLIAILQRKNNIYSHDIPKKSSEFILGKVVSCH